MIQKSNVNITNEYNIYIKNKDLGVKLINGKCLSEIMYLIQYDEMFPKLLKMNEKYIINAYNNYVSKKIQNCLIQNKEFDVIVRNINDIIDKFLLNCHRMIRQDKNVLGLVTELEQTLNIITPNANGLSYVQTKMLDAIKDNLGISFMVGQVNFDVNELYNELVSLNKKICYPKYKDENIISIKVINNKIK